MYEAKRNHSGFMVYSPQDPQTTKN